MSWLDRINNVELSIITGEGSEFLPLWKNATREREMNASKFDFNDIEKSLVRRGKVSSFSYPVELHFVGIDNIDEAERFELASRDQRPWTITHPFYGEVLVQPTSFNQDNNKLNDTVFRIDLFETIPDTYPNTLTAIQAQVLESVDVTMVTLSQDFADIPEIEPPLILTILDTINEFAAKAKELANTATDLANLQNAINDVLNTINNIVDAPATFMDRVAELARTPARFLASVEDRIDGLVDSYENLQSSVNGLVNLIPGQTPAPDAATSKYFEAFGGMINASIAEASVVTSNEIAQDQGAETELTTDYLTKTEVLTTANTINENFNNYINQIGSYQSVINATPSSYTPSVSGINSLKDTVTKATGQLLQVAVGAKQERTYTLPTKTNLILLVHKLLGNTDNDTMSDFTKANNILLGEWLELDKGRTVIYYL